MSTLTQGGVYLARLDPAKSSEVGKIRPVVVLTAPTILEVDPPTLFICPLSSQSYESMRSLHIEIAPRDNLKKLSFALVEHCRSISTQRLIHPRLAQLTLDETTSIAHRLQKMIGL